MSNNVIKTKNDETIDSFFSSLERMIRGVANVRKRYKPHLGGQRYLTDAELSKRLKINRRTLQDYRNMGRIPYIKLGGKILYREEDIEGILQSNYHK
ncbi:MAG: helix-turn-helix domain-containing protein [Rikenellaceae bacterium]